LNPRRAGESPSNAWDKTINVQATARCLAINTAAQSIRRQTDQMIGNHRQWKSNRAFNLAQQKKANELKVERRRLTSKASHRWKAFSDE